jgi:hypothetical protein
MLTPSCLVLPVTRNISQVNLFMLSNLRYFTMHHETDQGTSILFLYCQEFFSLILASLWCAGWHRFFGIIIFRIYSAFQSLERLPSLQGRMLLTLRDREVTSQRGLITYFRAQGVLSALSVSQTPA